MNFENYLSWKIVLSVSEDSLQAYTSNKLFNIKTGNSFIKGIGGFISRDYSPLILDPTNVFHNALNNLKIKHGFEGRRFPYSNKDEQELNINIRLFLPQVIVITVLLKKPLISNIEQISKLQELPSHRGIYGITKGVCSLLISGDPQKVNKINTPKIYPCTQTIIFDECNWIEDSKAVEIITRHPEPNENIVSNVISKNAKHQLDSSSILVDRQGIFCRVPQRVLGNGSSDKKFRGTCNALEYAIAISTLLSNNFYKNLSEQQRAYIEELIKQPEAIILKSTTSLETWKLLVSEFGLETLFSKANLPTNPPVEKKSAINYFKELSTQSKTFWLFTSLLLLSIWIFKNTIYYGKLVSFISSPDIVIETPIDQEEVELSTPVINLRWHPVDKAEVYIVELKVLESGKWLFPDKDYRNKTSETKIAVAVQPDKSYKFIITALDSNDDMIALSDESYFDTITKTSDDTGELEKKHQKE